MSTATSLRTEPLNAAELSLELFCRGMRIADGDDGRGIQRTRAGLGSGIELRLPGERKDHWVNVPVRESFARSSPFELITAEPGSVLVDARDGRRYRVDLPARPAWYDRETSSGKPMAHVGVLQGTYLGVYVGPVCGFWAGDGSRACQFCTTGRNVGEEESLEKTVDDVVETAQAAVAESGITFVHLNTGYSGADTARQLLPFVRALKERVGVLVGVQSTPSRDLTVYRELRDAGADHVSFCYEFHDPEVLARWCPGKAHALGLDLYLDSIRECAQLFGRGAVSGEIIAGVEPVETTLRAVDWIASVGAFPTVCVFRPTIGSGMEHLPPPDPDALRPVFEEVWNACRRHRVPVGLAPGIEVSLVLTPDDCADLVIPTLGDRAWRVALAAARVASRPVFARRMQRTRRM